MQNQTFKFNQAQRDVLNVVSVLNSDEEVKALRKVLVKFMNERLQNELDKLWVSGQWSDEKLSQMKGEHMRTHYKNNDDATASSN